MLFSMRKCGLAYLLLLQTATTNYMVKLKEALTI